MERDRIYNFKGNSEHGPKKLQRDLNATTQQWVEPLTMASQIRSKLSTKCFIVFGTRAFSKGDLIGESF